MRKALFWLLIAGAASLCTPALAQDTGCGAGVPLVGAGSGATGYDPLCWATGALQSIANLGDPATAYEGIYSTAAGTWAHNVAPIYNALALGAARPLANGLINLGLGIQINAAAALNHTLLGNGTEYVDGGAPSGTILDDITAFSGTGLIERTGAGAYSFLADPLTVTHGGTGAATFAANGFLTGNGTGAFNSVQFTGLVLGNGASAPTAYAGCSGVSNQWISALSASGGCTQTQPSIANISGWGTGVATALGVNANATGGFPTITTKTTWTPADASGAGLSLSVNSASYYKIGAVCVVEMDVIYPSTASASAASISGVPCAETIPPYGGGGYFYGSTYNPGVYLISQNASPVLTFLNGASLVTGLTNLNLSSARVILTALVF